MTQPAVCILANKRNGTLYTVVISDLVRHIWQHKADFIEGFTRKCQVHMPMYFELCDDMLTAITREKPVKAGSCNNKITLIESVNLEWQDLQGAIA